MEGIAVMYSVQMYKIKQINLKMNKLFHSYIICFLIVEWNSHDRKIFIPIGVFSNHVGVSPFIIICLFGIISHCSF